MIANVAFGTNGYFGRLIQEFNAAVWLKKFVITVEVKKSLIFVGFRQFLIVLDYSKFERHS